MKKLLIVLFIFASISGYTASEEQMKEWKATTWRLNIMLKTDSVHGGAVQFTIMDHDPRDSFSKEYIKIKEKSQKEKRYSPDIENVLLSVAWDRQFADVKGDDLFLLFKNETNGFSSNTPGKLYYLVTKTCTMNENAAAWVMPLRTRTGFEQDITLDDSNVIFLNKITGF